MDTGKCEICGEPIELDEEEEVTHCNICGRAICFCCVGFIGDCNAENIFCTECTEEVLKDESHPCHECVVQQEKENELSFN